MKTISNDVSRGKKSHFAKVQEACRKDVEREFGVLQSRFAVVRYPAQTWSKDQMWEIMTCCVILHNMIIESEQEELVFDTEPYYRQGPLAEVDHQLSATWTTYHNMRQEDPRPTSAPSTAAGSGGAPMKAQGQRLARRVIKYEILFVGLYNLY